MSKINHQGSKPPLSLLDKYKLIHASNFTTIEALYQMLDQKKSIKKIKIGLISIGKSEQNLQQIKWNQPKHQNQFIQLCEQLIHHFEEERDQSMRSTQKNLSQMNEEITKMRKSLSEKGILLQFQNLGQPKRDHERQSNLENQQIYNDQGQHKNEQLKIYHRNEKINRKEKEEEEEEKEEKEEQEDNEKVSQKHFNQNQSIQRQFHQGNDIQSEKLVPNQQNELQKSVKSSEWQWGEKPEEQEKQRQEQYSESKADHQMRRSGPDKNNQKNSKVIIKNEKQTSLKSLQRNHEGEKDHLINASLINSENIYHLENGKLEKNKLELQAQQDLVRRQKIRSNPIEWTEIPMPEEEKQKKILQKLKKSKEKKLYTLPEQLDNQFYDEEMKKSKVESQAKKYPKYNPHLEILKKLNKNKKEQPEPRNELEGLYYIYRNKLGKLFGYYLKELKTSSFTFDEYPQSLDLKTFSSYFKHFKLAQLCKVSQIPKFFKKYSINGAWLNQDGFLKIHSRLLEISDDPLQEIGALVQQRQQHQPNLKLIRQLDEPESQLKLKQMQLMQKKADSDKKYKQLEEKLKKINALLSDQQILRLTRKAQPKAHSIQLPSNQLKYDRERLRKIVEAHSGIYKQDIIEKLNERKREKQKRHQVQMHRIISKYKQNEVNSQSNSSSSFNKSSQSSPHMHKIQGYAKRNNIKKHANQTNNKIEEVSGLKSKQKYKSEPKIKPYFVATQSPEKKNTANSDNLINQAKAQIYKELSLPKLPKRKMRQQSIYQSLKNIDTKAEIEYIKKLLGFEKNSKGKEDSSKLTEDQRIFNQFYSKEKLILEKQKTKNSKTVQNRMKFT